MKPLKKKKQYQKKKKPNGLARETGDLNHKFNWVQ
jgi:hypothetical protein